MTAKLYRAPITTLALTEAQVAAITEPALAALRKEHERILKREARKLEKIMTGFRELNADYQRTRTLALKAQGEIRELKHKLREFQ
jgi:DNA gyrase/topoisomerase IV subunit A